MLAAAEKTIVGTSHADVLRGTARADKIYGKAGNDKLYGNGGNDLLVGGAGTDTIYCGAGRDTVQAESKDVVAPDCEKVDYVDGSGGSTTTTTTPPPPPPPARPLAGHYPGTTAQGEVMSFDVGTGGVSVGSFSFTMGLSCSGGSVQVTFRFPGPYAVAADGTFGFDWSGSFSGSNATGTANVRGRLDTSGNASGTMHGTASVPYSSSTVECASDTFTWTATRQP